MNGDSTAISGAPGETRTLNLLIRRNNRIRKFISVTYIWWYFFLKVQYTVYQSSILSVFSTVYHAVCITSAPAVMKERQSPRSRNANWRQEIPSSNNDGSLLSGRPQGCEATNSIASLARGSHFSSNAGATTNHSFMIRP